MTEVIGIAPHKEGDDETVLAIDGNGDLTIQMGGEPAKKVEVVPLKFTVVEDACFIVDEKDGDIFSWQKGTIDAPHYKAYAFGLDGDELLSGTGLGDSHEEAAQDAVDWLEWMIGE